MKYVSNLILLSLFFIQHSSSMNNNSFNSIDQKLFNAVKTGNTEKVRALVAHPLVNINAKYVNNYNSTPLHVAAQKGHKEVIKILLAAGADVDSKNYYNYTALHEAAQNGHKEAVEMLLAAGADVNAKTVDIGTALQWAAYKGHKEVVEILLVKGADVNAKAADNSTALHIAAKKGCKEVVKLLLLANADLTVQVKCEGEGDCGYNEDGDTALHSAADNGHKEIVSLLLAAGADVTAKGLSKITALHRAAEEGDKEVVGILLAAGADVNAKDVKNITPLHRAVECEHKEAAEMLLIVEMLLAAGADVNAKNHYGCTALHSAAENDHIEVAEVLLSYTVQVEGTLSNHPVVLKAQNNLMQLRTAPNFKARVQLLNKGVYACPAIQELIDIKRQLLLDAVKQNNVETVILLLKEGFSLNTCGKDGNNLLHTAIKYRSNKVLELLLHFCSRDNKDVWNKANKAKLTPIQTALSVSNFEALKMMLGISSEHSAIDSCQTKGTKRPHEEEPKYLSNT